MSVPVTKAPVISTATWGPPLWRVLHGLSLVPDVDWMALLGALDGSLPCADCASHFHAWLVRHPFSGDPVDYVLALHNDVNRRTRKRAWTREQVAATYGPPGLNGVREAFAIVRPYLVGESRGVTFLTELLAQDNGPASPGPVAV